MYSSVVSRFFAFRQIFFLFSPGASRLPGRSARRCLLFFGFPVALRGCAGRRVRGNRPSGQGRCDPLPFVMLRSKLHSVVPFLSTYWAAIHGSICLCFCPPLAAFAGRSGQACFSCLCGTWDAPALVPNWSSAIFVVVVVVSVSGEVYVCLIFVRCFRTAFRDIPGERCGAAPSGVAHIPRGLHLLKKKTRKSPSRKQIL